MKLIIGLGNPGVEYQFTPHNAGFLAIDRIAEYCNATVTNRRGRALTAKARLADTDVLLAKPETYMNLSGLSVAALVSELEIAAPSQDVIVIYDELDLPLGTIRIRERGSANGHNGARSVSGALGTDEWLRVRVGVGKEPASDGREIRSGGTDYLLSPMRKQELEKLDEVLDRVRLAVEAILSKGPGPAMSEFNRSD
ncbi:MAG TPA: aminoacyl-tRNA hydrolase [Acidobacteriaceae bacterium]